MNGQTYKCALKALCGHERRHECAPRTLFDSARGGVYTSFHRSGACVPRTVDKLVKGDFRGSGGRCTFVRGRYTYAREEVYVNVSGGLRALPFFSPFFFLLISFLLFLIFVHLFFVLLF